LQVARHPVMGLTEVTEEFRQVSWLLCWFRMHPG